MLLSGEKPQHPKNDSDDYGGEDGDGGEWMFDHAASALRLSKRPISSSMIRWTASKAV